MTGFFEKSPYHLNLTFDVFTIPLLDHLSNEVHKQFSTKNFRIISCLCIIPSVFTECSVEVNWKYEVLEFAMISKEDSPYYHQIETELQMLERFWKTYAHVRLPTTIAKTIVTRRDSQEANKSLLCEFFVLKSTRAQSSEKACFTERSLPL